MEKTLATIQKLSKVGKVLSKILLVCCTLGAVLCAAGIVALQQSGLSLHDVMQMRGEDMSLGQMYLEFGAVIVILAAQAVVAWFAARYFAHELEAGTPFTFEGAEEMKKLGIIAIAVPLGAEILVGVVVGLISEYLQCKTPIDVSGETSLVCGIMFLVMSLIFKYGAQLREQDKAVFEDE